MSKFKSLELFTGAGGLAMGCTRAGFDHQALVERDKYSCHTIRENQQRGMQLVSDWCIHQIDVADFNYSNIRGEIDLLAGGPPCQPFSIGGNHHG
jgi:DNA (cytosine-5)-methyltransferase 1